MNSAVVVRDLTVAYQDAPVLWDVDVDVLSGSCTAIVGPNGAGKSTLLKAILGLVPIASGSIQLLGQPPKSGRRSIAYVPQRSAVDWDFPIDVLGVTMMGTYPRLGWFRRPGKRERALAMQSLDRVGMADFATRQIGMLSGGQQQRVFLARALAQDASMLILDEPFAGVDASSEQAIVSVMHELRDTGKTILAVHHDLDSAASYFDQAILLNIRIISAGPVQDTLSRSNLEMAYGTRVSAIWAS